MVVKIIEKCQLFKRIYVLWGEEREQRKILTVSSSVLYLADVENQRSLEIDSSMETF